MIVNFGTFTTTTTGEEFDVTYDTLKANGYIILQSKSNKDKQIEIYIVNDRKKGLDAHYHRVQDARFLCHQDSEDLYHYLFETNIDFPLLGHWLKPFEAILEVQNFCLKHDRRFRRTKFHKIPKKRLESYRNLEPDYNLVDRFLDVELRIYDDDLHWENIERDNMIIMICRTTELSKKGTDIPVYLLDDDEELSKTDLNEVEKDRLKRWLQQIPSGLAHTNKELLEIRWKNLNQKSLNT